MPSHIGIPFGEIVMWIPIKFTIDTPLGALVIKAREINDNSNDDNYIAKYKNALIPNEQQIKEFTEGDIDTPIYMVNLLKFKEKAEYEDKETV